MSILKRLFGARPAAPAPTAGWYDLPRGGYFEVAGVVHHKAELARVFPPRPADDDPLIVEVDAVIARDRTNRHDPNAVAVLLHGQLAGYIPRQHASAWASFLDRVEAEGYGVRATARVWIGNSAYYVNLRADEEATYPTPSEREAEREAKQRAAAEKAARGEERAAARAQRAEQRTLEAERRAAGLCPDCGNTVERNEGRGRPPVYCADCRARRAAGG